MNWLTRWWREGNADREELAKAEQELREAVDASTKEAVRSKIKAEVEKERTADLITTMERALSIVKEGERH